MFFGSSCRLLLEELRESWFNGLLIFPDFKEEFRARGLTIR